MQRAWSASPTLSRPRRASGHSRPRGRHPALALAVLLGALCATTATAQRRADAPTEPAASSSTNPLHGQVFQDWTVRCEAVPASDGQTYEQCHMYQDWQEEDRQLRILHIAVAYPRQQPDQAVAVMTLPLGVYLPPGVTVQIDQGTPIKVAIERCEAVGCKAGFALEEQVLAAMRRGVKANVTFSDLRRQPLTIPVSLRGFTAGLRALAN